MTEIYTDLHQFTELVQPINLSLHQYLLLTEEPVLVHTGSIRQARAMLPEVRQLLKGRALKYVLVSHFESDECGGLAEVVKEHPGVVTDCSAVAARQLSGFGIAGQVEIRKPGDTLQGKDFDFRFIRYPSEIHLQDGLLFMEKQRGIFFSSDLMFRTGDSHGRVLESTWPAELETSGVDRLPGPELRQAMMADLKALSPAFIATGHGPCVRLQSS